MSVEKKSNGRYLARWRDPSGRQRAQSFDRKVDADRYLASVVVDQLHGRYVDPNAGKLTVEAFSRQWAVGQPWRESTRSSRESVIEHQIVPVFGRVELRAVRPSDVQAWVGRLSASGLAASSVGTYFRVLAQLMIAARRDRLIHKSPCDGVRLPRADRAASSLTVLSAVQVAALADEVPRALPGACRRLSGPRAASGRGVRAHRGPRRLPPEEGDDRSAGCHAGQGERLLLRPTEDVELEPSDPAAVERREVLAAHLAEFGEGPDRLMFTTTGGAMIARQTWLAAFSSAAQRLGIDASTHDLRHHAASLLIASACSPRAVASFLGHKNASETLNTYAHLWPNDEDRITAAIDAGLRRDVHEMCTEGARGG